MATSKEEAELEYASLRMGRIKICPEAAASSSADESAPEDPHPPPPESDADPLDASISSDEAAAHKARGNDAYRAKRFEDAVTSYTLASSSAHASPADRATYLANLSAAHLALGAHKEAAAAATRCLEIDGAYRKARERRLVARKETGDFRGAAEDARELAMPRADVEALEGRAKEKEAKMQAEAMSQLKELGNSLLSNFGMSLDNFKAEQDPKTGSYSIQMKP